MCLLRRVSKRRHVPLAEHVSPFCGVCLPRVRKDKNVRQQTQGGGLGWPGKFSGTNNWQNNTLWNYDRSYEELWFQCSKALSLVQKQSWKLVLASPFLNAQVTIEIRDVPHRCCLHPRCMGMWTFTFSPPQEGGACNAKTDLSDWRVTWEIAPSWLLATFPDF